MIKHGFRKQNARPKTKKKEATPEKSPFDVLSERFKLQKHRLSVGTIIEYKGSAYNKTINNAFKTAEKCNKPLKTVKL